MKLKSKQSPWAIRKIVKDVEEMEDRKFENLKHSYINALPYLPAALSKCLENIPMPWTTHKIVDISYQNRGALTFVNESPKCIPAVFLALLNAKSPEITQLILNPNTKKTLEFPLFDDEEPIKDFTAGILARNQRPTQKAHPLLKFNNIEFLIENNIINSPKARKYIFDKKTACYIYDTYVKDNEIRNFIEELSTNKWKITSLRESICNSKTFEIPFKEISKHQPIEPLRINKSIYAKINQTPKEIDLANFINKEKSLYKFNDPERQLYYRPVSNNMKIVYPHIYCRNFPMKYYAKLKKKEWVKDVPLPNPCFGVYKDDPLDSSFTRNGLCKEGIKLLYAKFPFNKLKGELKRPQDVDFIKWKLADKSFCSFSAKKLRKDKFIKIEKKSKKKANPDRLCKIVNSLKGFDFSTTEWLDAALQLMVQARNILTLLIHQKSVTYMHLDYNFNLKPIKTLTTKERKRSRFGHSFHLVREMCKILKHVTDLHVKFRTGDINCGQLSRGLENLFNNIGEYTGIYRYKYKVMKQIKRCKFIQDVLNDTRLSKVSGGSEWIHTWRVWVFFFKSICPMLKGWLSGLLKRRLEGRKREKAPFTVTKQRLESQFDISIKNDLKDELFLIVDEKDVSKKSYLINLILKRFGDAWKAWKNNEDWQDEKLSNTVCKLLNKYVLIKSELYKQECLKYRENLKILSSVEKKIKNKHLGRYTRLVLKEEHKRQSQFMESSLSDEGIGTKQKELRSMVEMFNSYLEIVGLPNKIPFPPLDNPDDNTLLLLTVETVKGVLSNKAKLSESDRNDLETLDAVMAAPKESINKIKKNLFSQRVFTDAKVEYNDDFFCVYPVFSFPCKERLTDAFLNHYLFLEANKRNLFPKWIKPLDEEPLPISVYNFSRDICSLPGCYKRGYNSKKTVVFQTQLKYMFDLCDLTLLNQLLKLVMDPTIADYITSRNNVDVNYKDVNYTNSVGLIKGTYIYNFVQFYYGLFVDVMFLGVDAAVEITKSGFNLNNQNNSTIFYYRNNDKITSVLQFEESELKLTNNSFKMNNIEELAYRGCWDKSKRMKHTDANIQAVNIIFKKIQEGVPKYLFMMEWKDTNISILDFENRQLTFELEGFELRITPYHLILRNPPQLNPHYKLKGWIIKNETGCITSRVLVKVNEHAVRLLESKIKHILMSARNSVFTKMVSKWNSNILSFVSYFREAIPETPSLLKLLERLENKLQNSIKIGINTKMPSRFPPLVFYVLKELGGLEMISIGSTESQRFHLNIGNQKVFVPNVLNYILPWSKEIQKGQEAWKSYFDKKNDTKKEAEFLGPNDLVDEWDFGIPRISTLYRKERKQLLFDKGWRVRNQNNRYIEKRFFSFFWTSNSHDGNLFDIATYKIDMMEAFGTMKEILENTLYPATGFKDWKNLFWEKPNTFEASAKNRKLTQAQITGLKQIPNRRFILWWSPTINRTEVFMGYKVQLDLMGVYMHGKLTHLKVCYVQLMRSHLWQKIHESIAMDICQALDKQMNELNIHSVQKQNIHPKKSFKFDASCADIILKFKESLDVKDTSIQTKYFWIDLQLKWGDVDNKDVQESCRRRYYGLTSHPLSVYPSPLGVVIVIDLCYSTWSMFGRTTDNIRTTIVDLMSKVMRLNPALWVLRERVRKSLQLHQSEPITAYITPANYGDLFGKKKHWLVDDSLLYRVRIKNTPEGLKTAKVVNGASMVFDPILGKLYAKIVHKDTWAYQRRTAELSKWKCAEETLGLIVSEKEDNRPDILVVNKQALLNPLGLHMIDFPNILTKTSDIKFHLKSLEFIPCFYDKIVLAATTSHLQIINLYDDWLQTISPFTAFSRLVLILKAISIDIATVEKIVGKIEIIDSADNKKRFWPLKNDEEWIKTEIKLKDFILNDFCCKNGIKLSSLKPSDIKDIILDSKNERIKELNELADMSEKELRETLKNMGNIEKTAADKLFGKSEDRYRHDIMLKGKLALEAEFVTDSENEEEDNIISIAQQNKIKVLIKEGIKKHKVIDIEGKARF
eukprot:GAHX01002346.1.p1 GENE.GAHX01002346.1~~GAHX01002346.1.p1  ORF type:complete len:2012 (-),score=317.38 GAHX01002346.1:41-6076(-)